jgi:hypothetical protein
MIESNCPVMRHLWNKLIDQLWEGYFEIINEIEKGL